MSNASRRRRVRRRFEQFGIDTTAPGFYDHPAFAAVERTDPEFLENYAWFVEDFDYSDEYLSRARVRIRQAATYLLRELKADGRKGACIDASTVLGQMLEQEGIWNYAVRGAFSIVPPAAFDDPPTHFGNIVMPGCPASAAHVWLVAPPYRIIDVTVAQQPYYRHQLEYLPDLVLAESVHPTQPEADDLFEPPAFDHFVAMYGRAPSMADVEAVAPGLANKIRGFGPVEVAHGGARLRYLPCGITALDGPLERAKNLVLRGKLPAALYAEFRGLPVSV